ncbi:hypothetical protein ACLXBB_36900, partial [Pseudomonas aeruginosa]
HAGAPWQLGACSYLPLGEGRLLLSRVEAGGGQLFLREADGSERRLAADWNRFATLARPGNWALAATCRWEREGCCSVASRPAAGN